MERFQFNLLRYWYIISCVAMIPLVACLATWYLIWVQKKRLLLPRCFRSQIQYQYWKHKTTYHYSRLSNSCKFWYEVMGQTCALTQMGYNPITWLEWVILQFLFVMPNLYSRVGSKPLEGIMPVSACVIGTDVSNDFAFSLPQPCISLLYGGYILFTFKWVYTVSNHLVCYEFLWWFEHLGIIAPFRSIYKCFGLVNLLLIL